jgi:putative ABC transport system permease protein
LTIAHGGEKDFSVLNQQQNIAATSSVLSLMTITVAAMAAVSLVVGGIGIMNIMLASVTERTHEIGVRKAMGATNRQIVNQFMFESALLGIFGGVIGICVSLIGVLVLRLYTSLQPIVSWQAIVIATSASLLIGVVFGVVPAFRAAHKDPIEALRHE